MELTRLATAAVMREGLDQEGGDSQQTELWVEKFKPKSYTELLSDNGTNRTLLMWLKLWDKAVFGREVRVRNKNKKDDHEEGGKNPQQGWVQHGCCCIYNSTSFYILL